MAKNSDIVTAIASATGIVCSTLIGIELFNRVFPKRIRLELPALEGGRRKEEEEPAPVPPPSVAAPAPVPMYYYPPMQMPTPTPMATQMPTPTPMAPQMPTPTPTLHLVEVSPGNYRVIPKP